MKLDDCAEQLLWELASWCGGEYVARLLMCGCRALSHKLSGAPLLSFRFGRVEDVPLAHLNEHFPNIRHLQIASYSCGYPLPRFSQSVNALIRMDKLVSLKLDFTQSTWLLQLGSLLKTSFPSLEDLKLLSVASPLRDLRRKWIPTLPPTLKRLSIQALAQSRGTYAIWPKDLLDFPTSLESLDFPICVVTSSDPQDQIFSWPPNLTYLNIKFDNNTAILQLPKTLEHLVLDVTFRCKTPVFTSQLPPHLKSLHSRSWSTEIHCDGFWPLKLESVTGHLSKLPHLILPTTIRRFEPLLWNDTIQWSEDTLTSSYPHLTSLYLEKTLSSMKPQTLPPTLTHLDLNGKRLDSLHILPQTLTKLSNISMRSGQSVALPTHLRDLILSISPSGSLVAEDFAHLPSSLTRLVFPLDVLAEVECLAAIPTSVCCLEMLAQRDRIPSFIASVGEHIPLNLETLVIFFDSEQAIWPKWMTDYMRRQPTQLKSLHCHADSASPSDHQYLKKLPPNLTALTLPLCKDMVLNKACLAQLPRNLQQLRFLDVGSREMLKLSDELFSSLPSSLTKLSMPAFEGLTSRFAKVIPSRIAFMEFSAALSSELFAAIRMYYQATHWEESYPSPVIEEALDEEDYLEED